MPNLLNISRDSEDDYEKYMIDIVTKLGTSNKNLDKDVKNVVEFARRILPTRIGLKKMAQRQNFLVLNPSQLDKCFG